MIETSLIKPDGEIEFENSPCRCPPDTDTGVGMHVNHGSTWYRIGGGEWKRVELGNEIDYYELAKAARTCEEFEQALQ